MNLNHFFFEKEEVKVEREPENKQLRDTVKVNEALSFEALGRMRRGWFECSVMLICL
jgi:hypothetical protein